MHTLARYGDAVRAEDHQGDAWLALSVLHKRALSSAWSLARSVERRLPALSGEQRHEGTQMALPLGDPQGELIAADEAPAWPGDLQLSDSARERRLLSAVYQRARSAAGDETKIAALGTLLRRARQPAVVFTEYRDTLLHVRERLARPAVVLHGGLTREERASVLASFARDPHGLLLATDAAAEGLNLHHHCRLVVNLELPWNPMRLEQRIGRVDRIGQQRTVTRSRDCRRHRRIAAAQPTSRTRRRRASRASARSLRTGQTAHLVMAGANEDDLGRSTRRPPRKRDGWPPLREWLRDGDQRALLLLEAAARGSRLLDARSGDCSGQTPPPPGASSKTRRPHRRVAARSCAHRAAADVRRIVADPATETFIRAH